MKKSVKNTLMLLSGLMLCGMVSCGEGNKDSSQNSGKIEIKNAEQEEENIVIDNDNSFMANWLFNYGDMENGENYNFVEEADGTYTMPIFTEVIKE